MSATLLAQRLADDVFFAFIRHKVAGLATGLVSALVLIVLSPSIMGVDGPSVAVSARHLIQRPPVFPLENPGIVSIPLAS